MRRSVVRQTKIQVKTALVQRYAPRKNSGYDEPYVNWRLKQELLFRNVFEAQYEHLRRVYRRQWYEAYIVNADEYITKYNVTKAAQLVEWESEMEAQETARRDAYAMNAGRQALRSKHLDILREFRERKFFHWYERASERLQYASKIPFVTRENLEAHIHKELMKYVRGEEGEVKHYPLNFVGQMPLIEDRELNIVAAPRHSYDKVRTDLGPGAVLGLYEAPEISSSAEAEQRTSAAVHALESEDITERELSAVVDDMVLEQEKAAVESDEFGPKTEEARDIAKRRYIQRGMERVRDLSRAAVGKKGTTVSADIPSPTLKETKDALSPRQTRERRRREQEAFNRAQKFEGVAATAPPSGAKPQQVPPPRVQSQQPPRVQSQQPSSVQETVKKLEAMAAEEQTKSKSSASGVKIGEIRTGKLRRKEATEEQIHKLADLAGPTGRGVFGLAQSWSQRNKKGPDSDK